MQKRWKSKVAWLTLLPVIIMLGDTYGLWNVINMDASTFEKLFIAILGVLVAFGIFNNPQSKNSF